MKVPFMDLAGIHEPLAKDILAKWQDIFKNASFIGGKYVAEFENDFARYIGTSSCVGVSSGTDALRLALLAMEVGEGDEVITTPNTFFATVEAIEQTGAKTVFCDVDQLTGTMSAVSLMTAITKKTKAVIPVHLYGQACDMEMIRRVTKQKNLLILEDACQAHGARYKNQMVGTLGDAAAFSFYPSKNLGACGNAGAVVTDNPQIAERVAQLRDHGQKAKGNHAMLGYTARMDACQAAALSSKLPYLDVWNLGRRGVADQYEHYLRNLMPLQLPDEARDNFHVWHLYVIQFWHRNILRKRLEEAGIGVGVHYPASCFLTPALDALGRGGRIGDFPVAERFSERGLSLPIFPTMTDVQVDAVCIAVRQIVESLK